MFLHSNIYQVFDIVLLTLLKEPKELTLEKFGKKHLAKKFKMDVIKKKLAESYKKVEEKYTKRLVSHIPKKRVDALYNETLSKIISEEKNYKANKTPYSIYHNTDAKKTVFQVAIKKIYDNFQKQVSTILNIERINDEIMASEMVEESKFLSIFKRVGGAPLYVVGSDDEELNMVLLNAH